MLQFVEKHGYLVVVVMAIVMGIAGLHEHDARVAAEAAIKVSNDHIKELQNDKTAIVQAGQKQIVVLQRQAAAVKTPAQAIAALPDVSALPLNARPVPNMPTEVTVDAVPLFQELNTCKQTTVGLSVCQATFADEQKIETELRGQIKVLSKKPSFWKRVKKTAMCGAIEAAPFFLAKNPSMGLPLAGAGALVCEWL